MDGCQYVSALFRLILTYIRLTLNIPLLHPRLASVQLGRGLPPSLRPPLVERKLQGPPKELPGEVSHIPVLYAVVSCLYADIWFVRSIHCQHSVPGCLLQEGQNQRSK